MIDVPFQPTSAPTDASGQLESVADRLRVRQAAIADWVWIGRPPADPAPIPGSLGTCRRQECSASFVVSDIEFAARATLPRHRHPDPRFSIVTRGSLCEQFDQGSQHLKRFDLSFKPAGCWHRTKAGPAGARWLVIQATPRGGPADGRLAAISTLDAPFQVPRRKMPELGRRLVAELKGGDLATRLGLEAVCLDIVVGAARLGAPPGRRAPPEWLQDAKLLLDQHYDESMGLEALADELGIHPVHLATTFRRWLGVTLGEYRRSVRLRRAEQLVAETNRSLGEVGVSCGFYDQSHFIRAFRREFGQTPGQYRTHPVQIGNSYRRRNLVQSP